MFKRPSVKNEDLPLFVIQPLTFQVQLTERLQVNPELKEPLLNGLIEMLSGKKAAALDDDQELVEGLNRLKNLSIYATQRGLKLLVDAEYTYMKEGINLIAMAMMCHYNINLPQVGNTYQCYLKVTSIHLALLKRLLI